LNSDLLGELRDTLGAMCDSGEFAGRRAVLFGANHPGDFAIRYLRGRGVAVSAVIDNNALNAGTLLDGVPVSLPEDAMLPFFDGALVLICSRHYPDMRRQLESMGYGARHVRRLLGMGSQKAAGAGGAAFREAADLAREGLGLYARLKREHGEGARILITPVRSLGDTCAACAYLDAHAARERAGSYVYVCLGGAAREVAGLFGIRRVHEATQREIDALAALEAFAGGEAGDVEVLQPFWRHTSFLHSLLGLGGAGFFDLMRHGCLGLEGGEPPRLPGAAAGAALAARAASPAGSVSPASAEPAQAGAASPASTISLAGAAAPSCMASPSGLAGTASPAGAEPAQAGAAAGGLQAAAKDLPPQNAADTASAAPAPSCATAALSCAASPAGAGPAQSGASDAAGRLLASAGLPDGRTVILAPYANNFPAAAPEFFALLAARLKERGLSAATNCAGAGEAPVAGTPALSFPLGMAAAVLERAGGFVGYRSGFCDLASTARCRKAVVYPDKAEGLAKAVEAYSIRGLYGNWTDAGSRSPAARPPGGTGTDGNRSPGDAPAPASRSPGGAGAGCNPHSDPPANGLFGDLLEIELGDAGKTAERVADFICGGTIS
jgi:hypothetical protein